MPKTFACMEALRALEPKFLNLIFMDFFKTLLPRVTVLRIVDSYLLEVCKDVCERVCVYMSICMCVCMYVVVCCICMRACVCVYAGMLLCACICVSMCVCVCVRAYCTYCMYYFLFMLNIYSARPTQPK